MLISRSKFDKAVDYFSKSEIITVDTETTGLRPYHGDRLFSIIMTDGIKTGYFNFLAYKDCEHLSKEYLKELKSRVFDQKRKWVGHNLKFDMHMLGVEGIELNGDLHCTATMERCLDYNLSDKGGDFALSEVSKRYGTFKEDTVSRYIDEHKLYTKKKFTWKKQSEKLKHFDQVPSSIMIPYGCQDVKSTHTIYLKQLDKIPKMQSYITKDGVSFLDFYKNEMRIIKTCYRMEKHGALIDRDFCNRAIEFENKNIKKYLQIFKALTGEEYLKSSLQNKRIFEGEKDNWVYGKPTKVKGEVNPMFGQKVLKSFKDPAAKCIIEINKATANRNYYEGFLYHADENDRIHTSFNNFLPRTGRFSSSKPNLQNLKKEKGKALEKEFIVRRAIIPPKDNILLMIDFDQMEYKLMLDYANPIELVDKVNSGYDIHQVTADDVGIDRDSAKSVNFGVLYALGKAALARGLDTTIDRAQGIKNSILNRYPEIGDFVSGVNNKLSYTNGVLFNWLGRVSLFNDPRFHYKGPNTLIQGGCADVVKMAMNRCDDLLLGTDVNMTLTIHDELCFEIPINDRTEEWCYKLLEVCETTYPFKYCKLTAGMDVSDVSFADKKSLEDFKDGWVS